MTDKVKIRATEEVGQGKNKSDGSSMPDKNKTNRGLTASF